MKVVSLVPSLTETLPACGVEVVGRTRYCVHPAGFVSDIAVVGGTKGVNWQKVADLAPDLVVMDKEENTRENDDQNTRLT
ncbi:MAG: helical backbone metal receptor [Pseudomonadales bacterium]|nr:helical backbone metal receptor [Pseudomonadales bacterium]MDP6472414.1 helical backbone metal receptor [Pseudomonadales bacterium]MDP6828210.1 helical backbone metal receptor [Pseudomonadales bacterium]